jgi:hypothetical protein
MDKEHCAKIREARDIIKMWIDRRVKWSRRYIDRLRGIEVCTRGMYRNETAYRAGGPCRGIDSNRAWMVARLPSDYLDHVAEVMVDEIDTYGYHPPLL